MRRRCIFHLAGPYECHQAVPGVRPTPARSFMYGLMTRQPLERCCEVACLAGASAVRVLGAELAQKDWAWFHARLHGVCVGGGEVVYTSPN